MKHILVVEDEEHLAVGIKYNLEAEGYRVTTAADGPAALKAVQEGNGVDLILLDLMLPGMSGYTVCETIRKTDQRTPVLILTARSLVEDRTRGFDVGANQYLTKPFELDELLSRVRNLLRLHDLSGRESAAPETLAAEVHEYEFAQAKVNFDTYEVKVKGREEHLTKLELKLLKYFFENEGRVIERHELLENVWDMPGHITTRAVDQFIRRLRKLFEVDPAHPRHFLTVRDAGYRFVSGK